MSGPKKWGGDCHVKEFAEKQKAVYVRGLRDLHGSKRGSTVDQGKRELWLWRKTELARLGRYAYTLLYMRWKKY